MFSLILLSAWWSIWELSGMTRSEFWHICLHYSLIKFKAWIKSLCFHVQEERRTDYFTEKNNGVGHGSRLLKYIRMQRSHFEGLERYSIASTNCTADWEENSKTLKVWTGEFLQNHNKLSNMLFATAFRFLKYGNGYQRYSNLQWYEFGLCGISQARKQDNTDKRMTEKHAFTQTHYPRPEKLPFMFSQSKENGF